MTTKRSFAEAFMTDWTSTSITFKPLQSSLVRVLSTIEKAYGIMDKRTTEYKELVNLKNILISQVKEMSHCCAAVEERMEDVHSSSKQLREIVDKFTDIDKERQDGVEPNCSKRTNVFKNKKSSSNCSKPPMSHALEPLP